MLRRQLLQTAKHRGEFQPVFHDRTTVAADQHVDRVDIDGFADSSGSSASNLSLSRERADTVYHTLRVLGIPAGRMSTEGHGEADPAVPNDSAVHRAANRRVTVTVR